MPISRRKSSRRVAGAASEKTVGRLSLYRRILLGLRASGVLSIFSHDLAAAAGGTAAQVRRDLMAIGYSGSSARGYDVGELATSIGALLDTEQGRRVALLGIGNMGRALLAYFAGRRPKLAIVAAFDTDETKVNRVIHGCRCYPMSELERVCAEDHITLGVIAVPQGAARESADRLARCGVTGILNFAPVALQVPEGVYVEDIDLIMSLEKVAFFGRESER